MKVSIIPTRRRLLCTQEDIPSFTKMACFKMELQLEDGRPQGTYVVYYPDGKIAEVRAYIQGAVSWNMAHL